MTPWVFDFTSFCAGFAAGMVFIYVFAIIIAVIAEKKYRKHQEEVAEKIIYLQNRIAELEENHD